MFLPARLRLPRAPAVLALTLLGGCAVGPDFRTPAPPPVTEYSDRPLTDTTATPNLAGGTVQRFSPGADLSADWWKLFHSAPLTR